MKTIMTLVGTSLITNYLKEDGKEDRNLRNLYERYMLVPAKKYDDNADDIVSMKKKLSKFAQTKGSSSAELKSIRKLTQEIKETDEFAVHLLASDTINSRICAEVVRDTLASDDQIQVRFEKKHIVNGLQVTDRSRFATLGMENLFSLIESLTGGYYGYTIINITGGYKATIPYLTIFSQINRIPLYYIFEETEELIKIPLLPISVDWELFETYSEIFLSAEKNNWGIEKWDEAEKRIQKEHREIFLDYYQKNQAPSDWQNPIPINFLTIKNATFDFAIGTVKKHNRSAVQAEQTERLISQAKAWIQQALADHGIGAKTSVGYGILHVLK